jgi:DNA-binding GntR family transcriptional regulator
VTLSFKQHNRILAALEARKLKQAVKLLRDNDLAAIEPLVMWLSQNKMQVDGDTAVDSTVDTER